MNAARLFSKFSSQNNPVLVVKRSGGGRFRDGKFETTTETTFELKCISIQPVRAKMIGMVDFTNQDETQWYRIYTTERLMITDEQSKPKQKADIVCIDGVNFEVMDVQDYMFGRIPHYKVMAVRSSV